MRIDVQNITNAAVSSPTNFLTTTTSHRWLQLLDSELGRTNEHQESTSSFGSAMGLGNLILLLPMYVLFLFASSGS